MDSNTTIKRLTKRIDGYIARECPYPQNYIGNVPCYGSIVPCYGCIDRTKCNALIMERLAQYEDLGMSPDELKTFIAAKKLKEGKI